MKKLAAFVFLILIISPFQLIFTKFQVEKYLIKKEVKNMFLSNLPPSELETLIFSKEDAFSLLEWEHESEFEFKGEMYDVLSREERGDSLVFLCFPDKKESDLKNNLRALIKIKQGERREEESVLSCDFLFKIRPPLQEKWSMPRVSEYRHCTQAAEIIYGRVPAPPSPPPQRV